MEEVEREVAPLPEEEVENEDAPLPRTVEKESAPRPEGRGGGIQEQSGEVATATGSGGGDLDPRSGSLGGEDGSDGHVDHRVQLPRRGGEDESSGMSSSSPDTESSPPAGLNDRIKRALEDIAREEAEMWAEIRRNPSQFENDLPAPEVNPLFLVLKTPCGTVYHIQGHCHHLLAPRVSPPRRYQWCAMCQMVSLATRGRPPPGIELHLSERTGTYHTDTRCPRNVNTLIYRVCLTCMSDQGAA
eukprot:s5931_g4.t1